MNRTLAIELHLAQQLESSKRVGGQIRLTAEREKIMVRDFAFAIGQAAALLLFTTTLVLTAQAQFGTEKEAQAMLERAVAKVKENKEKALEMFNKGEGGFKDRDLYCSVPTPRTGFSQRIPT